MANNHLTLDEIGVQHDTMQNSVIAKSSDKIFETFPEAVRYIGWCANKALLNLKVKLHPGMQPGVVDDIMKAKQVEIQQYKSNEHSGTYIYKDTDLEYFVSDIIKKTRNEFIIFDQPKFVVRSNVT